MPPQHRVSRASEGRAGQPEREHDVHVALASIVSMMYLCREAIEKLDEVERRVLNSDGSVANNLVQRGA